MINRINKKIVLPLAIAIVGGVSCDQPRTLEGVITKESFHQGTGMFGESDKYMAIVELSNGEKVIVKHTKDDAIKKDLQYDVGDTVDVQDGYTGYTISEKK